MSILADNPLRHGRLESGCGSVALALRYSLRASFPHKRVDYIFVRNLKPRACYVLKDIVSDHRAVDAWVQ